MNKNTYLALAGCLSNRKWTENRQLSICMKLHTGKKLMFKSSHSHMETQ